MSVRDLLSKNGSKPPIKLSPLHPGFDYEYLLKLAEEYSAAPETQTRTRSKTNAEENLIHQIKSQGLAVIGYTDDKVLLKYLRENKDLKSEKEFQKSLFYVTELNNLYDAATNEEWYWYDQNFQEAIEWLNAEIQYRCHVRKTPPPPYKYTNFGVGIEQIKYPYAHEVNETSSAAAEIQRDAFDY